MGFTRHPYGLRQSHQAPWLSTPHLASLWQLSKMLPGADRARKRRSQGRWKGPYAAGLLFRWNSP